MFKRSITFISNWSDKHFLCILKIKWPNEWSLENISFVSFKYVSDNEMFPPQPQGCVESDIEHMLGSEMESIAQEADTRSGVGEVTWPCYCILHH